MRTTISHRAPIEERQCLIAEQITTETMKLYRQADDLPYVKDAMQCRYGEIVPATDQWWLSEGFYDWLVEYTILSSTPSHRHVASEVPFD